MNIIERYISAYIVQVTTGAKGEQPSWPYDVLKHTDAKSGEPVLQAVLDAVKQSNGNSLELKAAVLDIVAKAVKREGKKIAEPKVKAMYSRNNGMYVFSVWENKNMVGLVVCSEADFELAKEKIAEAYPDTVFVDINAQ